MERLKSRLGWALAGALGIILVLALGRATLAGPLDPPGPVGSTMRTIDELLPSWGKTLAATGGCASQRFTCVLPTAPNPTGEAVLDHETGLVWERVPSPANVDFLTADATCSAARIGGRYGWRLPTISELLSLHDTTAADSLPAGHPFTKTFATYLWSQTANPGDAQRVWTMVFNLSGTFNLGSRARFGFNPADNAQAWCVRGANDASAQQPAEQPDWARLLDATGGCNSARFTCVMSNEAVLDRETGLVWELSPSPSAAWTVQQANGRCNKLEAGGRFGWRMPQTQELFSLLDPTQKNSLFNGPPALAAGHPFTNVSGGAYWVKDRYMPPFNSNVNMVIVFLQNGLDNSADASSTSRVWCVRGANGSPTPW